MSYGKIKICKNELKYKTKIEKNTQKFLKILTDEFAKKSKKLFDTTGELIYYYREKQLHSILVPIIDEFADAIITEMPIDRNKENYGWVDYWVKYGSTIFLIELKHSYFNITSNVFRKNSKEEWRTAIEQIKSLKKINHLNVDDENIVRIAFNVITLYKNSSSTIELNIDSVIREINNIKLNKLHKTTYQPEFISYWIPPINMSELTIEWTNSKEKYPAVVFIAKTI